MNKQISRLCSMGVFLVLLVLMACQANPSRSSITVLPKPSLSSTTALLAQSSATIPLEDNLTLSTSMGDQSITLPVGTSEILSLHVETKSEPKAIAFSLKDVPSGSTYSNLPRIDLVSGDILLKVSDTPPGTYLVEANAIVDEHLTLTQQLSVTVIPCHETKSGTFTQAVTTNVVSVIKEGKPDWADGLLIPVLVCKHNQPVHLKITEINTLSEANTPMGTTLFYFFRSRVYPAPSYVDAHNVLNVDGFYDDFPPIYNVNQQSNQFQNDIEVDPPGGLYLLVFLRDGYPSITDPKQRLAEVTYSIEI